MDEKDLEKLGLTRNEAVVYLALLKLGTTTSKAVIEKTLLHRQLVYDALDSLIEKGLVSFVIEANKKHFQTTNPKNFLEIFEKKENELKQQKHNFLESLKEINKIKEQYSEKQEVSVYQGKKGIRNLLLEMIEEKKEMMTLATSDMKAEAYAYHVQFNLPQFHQLRLQYKLPLKILFSEDLKERAKELSKLKYTEVRILPKEFTSNSSTNICSDKVYIIMWGSQPFGILIKSSEIAKSQKKYFDLLWKMARKI
jgi:sugar-specific transcriptional regulator TrmB